MLNSKLAANAAIAYSMSASDPLSLYDRLMAAKPPGLSRNAWAVRAGVSRSVFQDIRRRGSAEAATINQLLDEIGLTQAQFEAGQQASEKEAPPAEVRAPFMAFRGPDRPRDIPIVGTALCADIQLDESGEVIDVEAMNMDMNDVIDYARRPLALDNRRDVYAFYFTGTSMAPRYEPGELGYAEPKPPINGAYAVVQLRRPDGDDGERIFSVMAKKVVRQANAFIELEQFNPPMLFRVPRAMIAHVHRIIPWDELVSF